MKSFLSYPREQLDRAREVFRFLRSLSMSPWFDKENIVGGHNWDREISIAQHSAELIFLIVSQETFGRAGVIQREIRDILDLARNKPLDHIFIIQLRVEDTRPPKELEQYHYIDLFRPGWQINLARSLRLRLEQINESQPTQLVQFIENHEQKGGIQFRKLQTSGAFFDAQADYFIYDSTETYWEYVSAEITTDIFQKYYAAVADTAVDSLSGPSFKGIWSRRVEEFFRHEELVSLRFDAFDFFGGAHGTRGSYTMNFAGPLLGKLNIKNLFHDEANSWRLIRDACIQAFKRHTGSDDHWPHYFREDHRDRWDSFSQWTFNREGITLHLGMYSGLPYVMGEILVDIPWSILRTHVTPRLRQTAIGQVIGI